MGNLLQFMKCSAKRDKELGDEYIKLVWEFLRLRDKMTKCLYGSGVDSSEVLKRLVNRWMVERVGEDWEEQMENHKTKDVITNNIKSMIVLHQIDLS